MIFIKRKISIHFNDSILRYKISWAKNQIFISTGFKIDRKKFDGKRCFINSYHRDVPAYHINEQLDKMESKIEEIFKSCEQRSHIPSPDELRKLIKEDSASVDLFKIFDDFILEGERNKAWQLNTVTNVKATKEILRRYNPRLDFEMINTSTLDDFVNYMASHRVNKAVFKKGLSGYSNASIQKHCRTLKWFFSWATQKGYLEDKAWRSWKPTVKAIRQPVIFLEWDELMKLEAAEFEPGSIEERAKDFFVFCCFTGLRYSDAAELLKSFVHDEWFEVVTKKTATPLRIEFNSHSRKIIDKYKDSDSPFALPRITNNLLNRLLKTIGEVVDIKATILSDQFYGADRIRRVEPKFKRLSSHCARRTFICNALALGIAPHIVMKWTGHTEYMSMKPYIEAANSLKAEAMKKFG